MKKLANKYVIVACFICVVLLVVYSTRTYYKQNNAKKTVYNEKFEQATANTDPKKRMETLIALLPSLPKDLHEIAIWQIANDALVVDPTVAEKYLSKLAASKQKHIDFVAEITKAQLLITQKKSKEAVALLVALKKHVIPEMEQIYLVTLAQAQEESQALKDALQTYKKIASTEGLLKEYAQFKITELNSNK